MISLNKNSPIKYHQLWW